MCQVFSIPGGGVGWGGVEWGVRARQGGQMDDKEGRWMRSRMKLWVSWHFEIAYWGIW